MMMQGVMEKKPEKGRIIGVVSLKGGVGKTTTVSNLGAVLSQQGKKVLVVDANFSSPNLGLHLGCISMRGTIHDVLARKKQIPEAIHVHEAGFHIIPSAYASRKKITDHKALKKRIGYLKDYYDYILLDSSPNLHEEILSTMFASDELLVVTSPDYPTLSTTLRAVKLAKQRKTPISGLVLTRVRNKRYELTQQEIEEAAGVPVQGLIPECRRVPESIARTTPVALYRRHAKSTSAYRKLAATITGEAVSKGMRLAKFWKGFGRNREQAFFGEN